MLQILGVVLLLAVCLMVCVRLRYPTIISDANFILTQLRRQHTLSRYAKMAIPFTIADRFEEHAAQTPERTMLIFEDKTYSYDDINRRANRIARMAQRLGFKRGDKVALFVGNEPAFIWTLLGFCKLGVTCALLNVNLRSKSLLHCFEISGASTLVTSSGDGSSKHVDDIRPELKQRSVSVWTLDPGFPLPSEITDDDTNLPRDVRSGLNIRDAFAYIYTSGTTGLPKATRLTHYKLLAGGFMLNSFQMTCDDVMYITLPLYHISALFIGLSNVINNGATCVLRRKFSASKFWIDCRKHNVTMFMYIGELFRYLIAQPKTDKDRVNNVRLAIGNGLGADIWQEVCDRFDIDRIVELYGATEANFGLMNVDNTVGSVGRWSPLLQAICKIELIQYDYETSQPIRDEQGRCIPVAPGETGLLICPINRIFPLEGYVGSKALTETKLVRNVRRDGDVFFNTGDLFVRDANFNLFFKDRIGDTFRWKGENVATTEVAQTLNELPEILEASVYGVTVPGHYGKAGMTAIALKDGEVFNPRATYKHVTSSLPNYACPRFVRVSARLEHTATFKQKKTQLVQEGFNVQVVSDPVFMCDQNAQTYVRVDEQIYANILNGNIRL
ncbi:long-chain fatty acid transport protein 2-like [Diadema antillarum]|uniref:long-chain fatty acid transport protein 2-like n=1 Tax=Diadema antillarum TaxID=105358 RepID=UPI003A8791B9